MPRLVIKFFVLIYGKVFYVILLIAVADTWTEVE